MHDNRGEYEPALDYYRQSLEINLQIGSDLGAAEDFGAMAAIAQVTSNGEQARNLHLQALRLQQKVADRRGMVWTLTDLGILARDSHDFAEAERCLTQALKWARHMQDPHELYDVYLNRGDIRLMIKRWRAAARDYAAAADALETVRRRLIQEKEALAYFDEPHVEVYDRLVRLYARVLHEPKKALLWEERTKSREWSWQLRLTRLTPRGIRKGLLNREQKLLDQMRTAAVALSSGTADHLAVIKLYEQLERNLTQVWSNMEPCDPEYVAFRRGEPLTWRELHRCLAGDASNSTTRSG